MARRLTIGRLLCREPRLYVERTEEVQKKKKFLPETTPRSTYVEKPPTMKKTQTKKDHKESSSQKQWHPNTSSQHLTA